MLNIQCIFANTEYIYQTTSMSPCQFLESFHVSHASGHMYTCTLSIVHVAVPPGIFAEDGCLWVAHATYVICNYGSTISFLATLLLLTTFSTE